jgi:lipopolysaccharide/colanic/teichoic acid biosynthesis glycosyltransferase
MKRTFDIIASSLGLIILSPLFIILAILIKLDSEGPVFFKQIRVGLKNKDFSLYKFRSMYVKTDESGFLTIGDRDPRITPIGYYIRKYKLDEFPQLLNVLKGDMSIVGPRPQVRKFVNLYTAEQMRVLDIRPGITDLASIRYRNESQLLKNFKDPEKYYTEVVMQDKLRINLQYLDNHNLLNDIALIFLTFKTIIKG